ncbi:GNAT family N-acetyltransferase [Amaricoccus macauensis]|uniref:GNAT family N-acetyltransferase n=1 Tax=Amaricoccus macauensis TaxID=57001 RepID=UPI003C7BE91B
MMAEVLPKPWERAPQGPAAQLSARICGLLPVLETERLRLRAPRIEDYPVYSGFVRDDRGAGLVTGERDRRSWHDFCELVAGWTLRGHGAWTIETLEDGAVVGVLTIDHEYGDPEPEIGWLVTPAVEGRGFATEAARVALDWAFGTHGFTSLVSYIDGENARSIRVAERLGARRDAQAEAGLGCRVYRFIAEEARQ